MASADQADHGVVQPLLDREALLARAGGDAVLVRDMARLFLEVIVPWMVDIRSALARKDTGDLHRAAHRIKGSAANFISRAVPDAAHRLELAARAGDLSAAPTLLADLELEVDRLRQALEQLAHDLHNFDK